MESIVKSHKADFARDVQKLSERRFSLMSEAICSAVLKYMAPPGDDNVNTSNPNLSLVITGAMAGSGNPSPSVVGDAGQRNSNEVIDDTFASPGSNVYPGFQINAASSGHLS